MKKCASLKTMTIARKINLKLLCLSAKTKICTALKPQQARIFFSLIKITNSKFIALTKKIRAYLVKIRERLRKYCREKKLGKLQASFFWAKTSFSSFTLALKSKKMCVVYGQTIKNRCDNSNPAPKVRAIKMSKKSQSWYGNSWSPPNLLQFWNCSSSCLYDLLQCVKWENRAHFF